MLLNYIYVNFYVGGASPPAGGRAQDDGRCSRDADPDRPEDYQVVGSSRREFDLIELRADLAGSSISSNSELISSAGYRLSDDRLQLGRITLARISQVDLVMQTG